MRIILALLSVGMAVAQQPPAFEAAFIKPNTSGDPASRMHNTPGQINIENYSLTKLIQTAYRVHDYAWSAPSWLDTVHFDVVAKIPADGKLNQFPEMLQALLVERFRLAVHREQKEVPGLALVVDRKGPHLEAAADGALGSAYGPSMVQGNAATMAEFAGLLTNSLNRPVQDLTGLSGTYKIKLSWMPDGPAPPNASDLAPSVFIAVQDLGLRLEVHKTPVEILVVDRVERAPIEN